MIEDSQLELFIEGLPNFLDTLSGGPPSAIMELTIKVMHHITKLLMACKQPSALAEELKTQTHKLYLCLFIFCWGGVHGTVEHGVVSLCFVRQTSISCTRGR